MAFALAAFIMCLCGTLVRAQSNYNEPFRYQVGLTLTPSLPGSVSDIFSQRRRLPLPLSISFKDHLSPRNAMTLYIVANTPYTTLNRHRHQLRSKPLSRFESYDVTLGYERTMIANKRTNFLAGLSAAYHNHPEYSLWSYPHEECFSMLRCRSALGLGVNIGARYNITKRLALESNAQASYLKPLRTIRHGQRFFQNTILQVPRGISLELHYRFGAR